MVDESFKRIHSILSPFHSSILFLLSPRAYASRLYAATASQLAAFFPFFLSFSALSFHDLYRKSWAQVVS